MSATTSTLRGVVLALLITLPTVAVGATIGEGQTRVVDGSISAIDIAARAVVLEVPTPEGELTVGVTLADSVSPQANGAPLPVRELEPGDRAVLKYTRQGGQLIGLELRVLR